MSLIKRKIIEISGLIITLSQLYGDQIHKEFLMYSDLNGDNIKDSITGEYSNYKKTIYKDLDGEWKYNIHYDSYNLIAEISCKNRFKEKALIFTFKNKPQEIKFEDFDKDGDKDLIFSIYEKELKQRFDGDYASFGYYYDKYLILNDGKGNFNKKPILINRFEREDFEDKDSYKLI